MCIDLHTHSNCSDGTLSPRELVSLAARKGLSAIALTDHDSVAGVKEALEAGRELAVEVISGIELSVEYETEMHILGYFIDADSPVLRAALDEVRRYRVIRNKRMVDNLRRAGIDISYSEVEAEASGETVGRVHMANVLVKKGYAADRDEAFERFVGSSAGFYESKQKLSPKEGIEILKACGGVAALAHPYLLKKDQSEMKSVISLLKGYGLDGLECYYTKHTPEMQAEYLKLASCYGLVPTGGSDFHGGNKSGFELGRAWGGMKIPYSTLERLKNILE